jgi:hypothetical protein
VKAATMSRSGALDATKSATTDPGTARARLERAIVSAKSECVMLSKVSYY